MWPPVRFRPRKSDIILIMEDRAYWNAVAGCAAKNSLSAYTRRYTDQLELHVIDADDLRPSLIRIRGMSWAGSAAVCHQSVSQRRLSGVIAELTITSEELHLFG